MSTAGKVTSAGLDAGTAARVPGATRPVASIEQAPVGELAAGTTVGRHDEWATFGDTLTDSGDRRPGGNLARRGRAVFTPIVAPSFLSEIIAALNAGADGQPILLPQVARGVATYESNMRTIASAGQSRHQHVNRFY